MELSKDKEEILNEIDINKCFLITGSAGTGKTTLGCMIGNKLSNKINKNQRILYLTFSNLAKYQISDRLNELIKKNVIDKQLMKIVEVNNYHSLWWNLICRYKGFLNIPEDPILLTDEELEIQSQEELENLKANLKIPSDYITNNGTINKNKKDSLLHILKGSALIYNDYGPENFGENGRKFKGKMDFLNEISNIIMSRNRKGIFSHNETIYWVNKLLLRHPNILSILRAKYPIIIIDEFQDSDIAQWEIIKMIEPKTLIAMGDAAQTIHKWRGADPERFNQLETFSKDIYKAYIHKELIKKHRSNIDFSNINNLNQRSLKINIFDTVKHNKAKYKTKLEVKKSIFKKLNSYKSIAVLCLENKQANEITSFIRKKNTFNSGGCFKGLSCRRIGSNYSPYEQAKSICINLINMKELSTSKIANEIVNKIFFPLSLHKVSNRSRKDIYIKRWTDANNVYTKIKKDFIQGLNLFIDLCFKEEKRNSYICDRMTLSCISYVKHKLIIYSNNLINGDLLEKRAIINNIILQYEVICKNKFNSDISVMTVHQSKGREFDFVIIPWFADIPWESINYGYQWDMNNDEHQNLFHTACTRAKKEVEIIYPKNNFAL
ncbi:UvrD-helicase domain-containing protein [Halanaerobium salsuginis]|uniref:DNA 3'-5' helicase n=1 Tax=Halanaerobium salsuginis TaxID=29563 RepID=A0A1I4K8M6_9FIRM|nr:UvrD-helicase domain-containing protein [Halanaerobium salsuginis]SFL74923.1 Superfamily I DNA or RNA helicase [Halanaerobium salsuginis]